MQGEICRFSNFLCVLTDIHPQGCDVQGANQIACLTKTTGFCRWDPKSLLCYENQTDLYELGCRDFLNQVLCRLVEKEPCIWDVSLQQCIEFINTSFTQFEDQSEINLSIISCLQITEGPYYYDFSTSQCKQMDNIFNVCDSPPMNEYACLLYTDGNLCYYDEKEINPTKRCKKFTGLQSKCQSSVRVNLEVCMKILSGYIFQ